MPFIDSDSVWPQAVAACFTSAAAAIEATDTAVILVARTPAVVSADKRIEDTNKALKADWITVTVNAAGESANDAA